MPSLGELEKKLPIRYLALIPAGLAAALEWRSIRT